VWVADHFVLGHEGGELEAWTGLCWLAALTTKVRLGALVFGVGHRNPALVAKMIATLDNLTGGRALLGMGAGWFEAEHRSYGIPWTASAATRIEMLDEALALMKSMFAGDEVSFAGSHYRTDRAVCQPAPVQKPWPPIWVGGGGEQKTLRVVARHADAWNIPAVPAAEYARKLGVLRSHCDAVGRDYREIEKTIETRVLVTSARSAAARSEVDGKLAAWLNYWRTTAGQQPLSTSDAVAQARGDYIIGSLAECRSRVREYADAGVEHFTPYFLDYPGTDSMEAFAGLVREFA
jgi:F420-dependent oxidoreductase-like protein